MVGGSGAAAFVGRETPPAKRARHLMCCGSIQPSAKATSSNRNSNTDRPIRHVRALTNFLLSPGWLLDRWNRALPKLTRISARIRITKYLNFTAARRQ
jgi:hypothetical protein